MMLSFFLVFGPCGHILSLIVKGPDHSRLVLQDVELKSKYWSVCLGIVPVKVVRALETPVSTRYYHALPVKYFVALEVCSSQAKVQEIIL